MVIDFTLEAELGGLGLDHRAQAVVLEEAGYSILGPQALNCAAPDEGNVNLLAQVASAGQRERYLRPLAEARVRSAFAMTEPAPGAGSDPAMLSTAAREVMVDRSVQICGSLGVSGDAPLARYLAETRPFRIYDGPTETHKWAIARRAIRQRAGAGA